MSNITRRSFLQKSAAATAALTIVPNTILGKSHSGGMPAPSDKLNIAAVGIGGMGHSNIEAVKKTENLVALCDVDWRYAKKVFDEFPNAKKYWDFRKMLDESGKDIDAVMVATADHTHAIVASTAITMGKHVYCQKPLTHTVYESRLLTKLAKKYGVVTQMGNQGASGEGVNKICEYIWNGGIGEVRKVDAATNRPIWPQGLNAPDKAEKVPKTLNWDLFSGPTQVIPYNSIYTPWNWRGWWRYGTGALGDMACHILHPAFAALKLGYPIHVEGSSTLLLKDCAPTAQHVKLTFPERNNLPKVAMPEVEVNWYDGGMMPDRPKGFPQGKELMGGDGGLTIFYGTKDTLVCSCYGAKPWLLSGHPLDAPMTERRLPLGPDGNPISHEMDWVRACKEDPANRVLPKSDFSQAGPFNEMVVMGVLAIRLQTLNRVLDWDGPNMRFTNINPEDKIRIVLKNNFHIVNGDPKFDKIYTDPVPAQEFAQELIKHTYRDGWTLPPMPA